MAVYLYVGSFMRQGGFGVFRFDEETGDLEPIGKDYFPEISVGHVLLDRQRGIMYATNERQDNNQLGIGGGGEVYALRIDDSTGIPTLHSKTLSYGSNPSYSAMDKEKRHLVVSHFTPSASSFHAVKNENGGYSVEPIPSDIITSLIGLDGEGKFTGPMDLFRHDILPGKHDRPHIHSVNISPDGKFFAACDMGIDRVYMYKIEDDKLSLASEPTEFIPESGPRYSAFHPTKPYLLINCEHKPIAACFSYDENGSLTELCSIPVLPDDVDVKPSYNPTGLSISADGRFLYVLIRGISVVSVVEVHDDGNLSLIQTYTLDGVSPRGSDISPDGRFLAVADIGSNQAEILRINDDGTLSATGILADDPCPGTVTFYKTKD